MLTIKHGRRELLHVDEDVQSRDAEKMKKDRSPIFFSFPTFFFSLFVALFLLCIEKIVAESHLRDLGPLQVACRAPRLVATGPEVLREHCRDTCRLPVQP